MHGYELHRRMETQLREVWRIPQNQAYNLLKRLEKEGLIHAVHDEALSGAARTRFQLTPGGRQHFEGWLHAPSPCSARAVRIEFLTRLYFAAQISRDLPRVLAGEQAGALRAAVTHLEERRDAVPPDQPFNRLALDVRVRQMRTLLDWIEEYQSTLETEVT